MENHIAERHIFSKKATSKLVLGIVYTGEEVIVGPDCIYQGSHLRLSMTCNYAASTRLVSRT